MEAFLAGLEGTGLAQALKVSRWGYATVNAVHILGIALLIGAVVPMNLRLVGLWRSVPRPIIARLLAPMAAAGLAIAVTAGLLLFSVRAREYAGIEFFQVKLLLIAFGTISALFAYKPFGRDDDMLRDRRLRAHAVVSLLCWLGALVCGRFIAFAE